MKFKRARNNRSTKLSAAHTAVMEVVAYYLDEEFNFVQDGVLDAEKHIMLLESFTTPGGCKAIIFNCCERSLPPVGK